MKIFVTDQNTNLCQTLIDQYNIVLINTNKCAFGQILYTLDYYVSFGYDVVYLSNKISFKQIVVLSEKVVQMHGSSKITIIDVESATIGKNNFALRLLTFQDINLSINNYQAKHHVLFNDELQIFSSNFSLKNI